MNISWAEIFWRCTATLAFVANVYLGCIRLKEFYEVNSEDRLGKLKMLMFREDRYGCRFHCQKRFECDKPDCAYKQLSMICHILGNATKSLDVCMCFITSEDLIGSILLASQRGVKVQVITDSHMMQFGDQVLLLERYGVPINKLNCDYTMHHKFAIVDDEILIDGSANWTIQAFSGNWESIIISSDEYLVQNFSQTFAKRWKFFQSTVL